MSVVKQNANPFFCKQLSPAGVKLCARHEDSCLTSVSDQLQAPAALSTRKEPTAVIEFKAGLVGLDVSEEPRNYSPLPAFEPRMFGCPAHNSGTLSPEDGVGLFLRKRRVMVCNL